MKTTNSKSRRDTGFAAALVAMAALAAGCAASRPQQVETDYKVPKHQAAQPAPAASPAASPAPAAASANAPVKDSAPVQETAALHDPAGAGVSEAECAPPEGESEPAGAVSTVAKSNKPAKITDVPKEYLHFTSARVRAGEMAPDFDLPLADGDSTLRLSAMRDRPTVLVFGSLTCDRFRASAPEVVRLHRDFNDVANFLLVYVREAHASDEWVRQVNEYVGIEIPQPTDLPQRSSVARTCVNRLKLPFPTVVDDMDDLVSSTYGAWPERLYIIDTEGRIAYQGGVGPAGFLPAEVRSILTRDYRQSARSAN